MHIDMDAYFASVEQATNLYLKGKPVIVCGVSTISGYKEKNSHRNQSYKTRSVVASCSYEAKRYGVKSGMNVREALFLCPDAIIVEGCAEKYLEVSREIFSIIKRFTEEVEIYSIDEVFIDISGIYNLYGGKRCLASSIKEAIKKETSLTCSAGIGPNKLIAKIASSICKPDGIKIVEKEEVENFISELPVEKIPGIGKKMKEKLAEFGIDKCRDIKKAGRDFLVEKFGTAGNIIYEKSMGRDNEEIIKNPPEPKSIGHSYTLPFDTINMEIIKMVIFKLSYKVAKRMRQKNKHGKTVSLFLRFYDFTGITKRKKLKDIPADEKFIFSLAISIFKKIKVEKRIRAIGVSIGDLFDFNYEYLFEKMGNKEILFHRIDNINYRFGENSVIPAILLLEKEVEIKKVHSFILWKV